jgi:hypothetical protein
MEGIQPVQEGGCRRSRAHVVQFHRLLQLDSLALDEKAGLRLTGLLRVKFGSQDG